MDAEEAFLEARARRAIPLIAAALTVIVVAGLLWLRPALGGSATISLPSPSPTAPLLRSPYNAAYYFATPEIGWAIVAWQGQAATRFWVFKTNDAARHWSPEMSDSVDVVSPAQIVFFNPRDGYFEIGPSVVYRTSDGGKSWTRVLLPPYRVEVVTFSDPTHVWYVGFEQNDDLRAPLVRHFEVSSDGGASWNTLPVPPSPIDVAFRNATEGWCGSASTDLRPAVYSTHDGGLTWQRHELPAIQGIPGSGGKPGFGSSIRLVPDNGVLAAVGDQAFLSVDMGATWRRLGTPPFATGYQGVVFQDAKHWWAMRSGDLYRSDDAGQTWHHVLLQLDDWEYIIGVIDVRHAWARLEVPFPRTAPVPGSGLALTSDGGVHWSYVKVPLPG